MRPLGPRLYAAGMGKAGKTGDAPATKADIRMLMGEIGKLHDATERWKDEIKHHFDLAVENIRVELVGANEGRIQSHEHRIALLEKHAGLTG